MKILAKILSALALLATVIPPILFARGYWDLGVMQHWLFASTLLWFATAPWWMEHKLRG